MFQYKILRKNALLSFLKESRALAQTLFIFLK